jgi:uncharacterized protein (DUF1501 family)
LALARAAAHRVISSMRPPIPAVSSRPKPANLYESRDLAPTTDLRAVIKGVLHDHLGVSERVLAETVFPDSAGVKAAKGLLG